MPLEYIDITTDHQLEELMARFADRNNRFLAMDFEGEFNLHVYGERLCLVQVYDGSDFYLVDPLAVSKKVLCRFLTMKNMLYMFYSADSDRSLVYKTLGVKMLQVYDLQHLVDVLDLPKKGLDAVLESQLGITVSGKKRYQRQNWLTRPIDEGAKQYALGDVAHLYELHRILLEKITDAGLTENLVLKIASSAKDWDKKSIPGIFKTPAFRKLSAPKQKMYRKIVDIREKAAEELDVPAHFVIPKQELVSLAENPAGIRRLRFGGKVSRGMQDRIIRDVMALV